MKRALAGILTVLFLATSTLAVTVPERPPEKNLYPKGTQMTIEQRIIQSISDFADLFESEKVEYVWGGSDPEETVWDTQKKAWRKGADCSGSVRRIFLLSGIKLPRLTSLKMWLTWPGDPITDKAQVWKLAKLPAVLWFTWPAKGKEAKRRAGHVVIVRHNKAKTKTKPQSIEFSEASSSKGYYKRTTMERGDYRDINTEGIKFVPLLPNFVGKK
jgi:hypothetical protein